MADSRLLLLAGLILAFCLPASAQADHAIEWTAGAGSSGVLGGQLNEPKDVAARESTGQSYVVDTGNNRVQRFDSAGNFEMAWGRGVVAPGGVGDLGGGNAKNTITLGLPKDEDDTTFVLRWSPFTGPEQLTTAIPRDASAATVKTALEGLGYIDPGDVIVTGPVGGPFTVEFAGAYAATPVNPLQPGESQTVGVSVSAAATPAFEICTVASQCRWGSPGSGTDGPGGGLSRPTGIEINQVTGQVYVTETKGQRVSVFSADGGWLRSFGWNTIQAGKPGDIAGPNEKQKVTTFAKSGTFKLILRDGKKLGGEGIGPGTTSALPFNASAAEVESALVALSAVAPGDVAVSGPAGGPWTIEFTGAFAGEDVFPLGFDITELEIREEAIKSTIETLVNGAAYEICTVAADCQLGTSGDAAGQLGLAPFGSQYGSGKPAGLGFLEREGIAIDQEGGDVFVGDVTNDRINQYDEEGNFVRSWGWGVDTGADAFEICTAASGCQRRFVLEGSPTFVGPPANGKFRESLVDLAFDSSSKVLYAAAYGQGASNGLHAPPSQVFRFDTSKGTAGDLSLPLTIYQSGSFVGWSSGGTLDDGLPVGIEVDASNGRVLLATEPRLGSGQSVMEIDPSTAPATVTARHLPLDAGSGFGLSGFGFDSVSDRIFLSTKSLGHRLLAASHTPAPPSEATAEPATDVEPHSATLHGSVTPNGPAGIDTFYRFEYRPDGSAEWLRAPIPDENKGDGTAPIAVSQEVDDLEAATLYHVRVVARRALSAPVISEEVTFTTGAVAPVVETLYPQARTDTGVRLTGLINPNGALTDYYFEWGETPAYGNKFPIAGATVGGGKPTLITEELEGLEPETTYHYRLIADNGIEEAPGDTTVEGEDVAFTTRATFPADPKRSFEMVSPPFKVTRSTVQIGGLAGKNANIGWPSLDGEALRWELYYFPLLEESGMPFRGEKMITRRTPGGWQTEALQTLPIIAGYPATLRDALQYAASADLETQAWTFGDEDKPGPILANEGEGPLFQYTRKDGTGTKGFTGWLDNVDTQQIDDEGNDLAVAGTDDALFNDAGSAMARWGSYRGLGEDPAAEGDEDRSDDLQLPGESGGRTAYLQLDPPNGVKDLVGECSGSGASATQIPERDANGTGLATDDFIDVRNCATGNLTSRRGTIVGAMRSEPQNLLGGNAVTALADDARRVFFTSPDPLATLVSVGGGCEPSCPKVSDACGVATGANTDCPPQIFVRQYDAEGNPTVRWISRSRSVAGPGNSYSGAPISKQAIGLLGPAIFEGASRDGRYVYFRTSSPLTPDDPSGTGAPGPVTSGSASTWDLYRYELPASHEEDPDAGSLTRISGGPTGTADPRVVRTGAAARYISDDGKRVYFTTQDPIPGADESSPLGGTTTPAGGGRKLYLYDSTGETPEWRFVASIPTSIDQGTLYNACASSHRIIGPSSGYGGGSGLERHYKPAARNCMRGTRDGRAMAFITHGRLTEDDRDDAADIYLYDVGDDELVRVTAPPVGVDPYICKEKLPTEETTLTEASCNGEWGYQGANVTNYDLQRGWGGARQFNVVVEPSGAVSLIFQSRSQLTSDDENVDEWDVYRWREGEVELLSLGQPGEHSYYSGNSLDGEDIFIWTNSRIDPREIDESDYDTYDLRIGEGFPPPPVVDPCDVLAFECESEAAPAPPVPARTTQEFHGDGNFVEKVKKPCPKGKVRRKGKCVKKKAKKKAGKRAGKGRKGGRK